MARKPKKKSSTPHLLEAIYGVLKKSAGKQMNYKQIAAAAGITEQSQRQLIPSILAELANKGVVEDKGKGKFRAAAARPSRYVTGIVDVTVSGAGYLITEELETDVYLNPRQVHGLMQGDTIKVKLLPERKPGKYEGEVVEVLKRAKSEFVGTVQVSARFAFLVPSGNKQSIDIYIPLEKLNGAKDGQKAIARITEWPAKAVNPIGEIIDVLGNAGENNTEMHAILAEYGLPYAFPEEVERMADFIPTEITASEIAKRRDFRKITTFTIDPVDAKDFDDALSIQQLANGNWEIGVHIADVSHYLKKDSVIDKEALSRATSVYLVDRVVPMLPEILSNNVCSLRPNEDKLCFSAVFELDEDAQLKNEWFGRTVIHSVRRYSYEEAQALLEDGALKREKGLEVPQGLKGDFQSELMELNRLAKLLRKERMRKGSIAFEKSEVKFHLDEAGNPTGVYFKQMKDSNQLIEDFMLLANRRVASFAGDRGAKHLALPFVYRIHAKPDETKLEDLSGFIAKFGYKINLAGDKQTVDSLNKLLKDVEGKSEANVISLLTIRSMAKAIYSTKNIGHYGLGFEFYTHFTSPIRRYPDVMVHRLLQHYLDNGKPADASVLELDCKHSSDMEKLAADAERSSIKYKQVQFLQDRVGEQFDGMISGVTEWGIFVELNENHCEGMVRIRDLQDDHYSFDEDNYCLVGRRFRKTLRLGDPVRIEIKGANLVKKQLDFVVVDFLDKEEEASGNGSKEKEHGLGASRVGANKGTKPAGRQGKAKGKPSSEDGKTAKKNHDGTTFNEEWGFEV